MAVTDNTRLSPHTTSNIPMTRGYDLFNRTAAMIFFSQALLWLSLLIRWATFNVINWQPLAIALALAQWPAAVAYVVFGGLLALSLATGVMLLRETRHARSLGLAAAAITLAAGALYYVLAREFYGTALLLGLGGMAFVLLRRQTAWSLAFPSAYWLLVFFLIPLAIVFVVSLGERARLGAVTFDLTNPASLFDDYARIFSRINGDFIYLRIFARSLWLALLNTAICLLFAYPFAYWIARQPASRRNILIFLVMIPFWTNFLVRTYAWMLILRDSGLINNVWTGSIHDLAVALSGSSSLFNWLAEATARPVPPAPRISARRPSIGTPCSSRCRTSPSPSVLKPISTPPFWVRTLTAPASSAATVIRSSSGRTASLKGTVRFTPARSSVRTASATRPARPGSTSKAR